MGNVSNFPQKMTFSSMKAQETANFNDLISYKKNEYVLRTAPITLRCIKINSLSHNFYL